MNVHDFGARGDGTANDGPSLRAAIAAAAREAYREKRILIPAGVYNVDTVDLTGTRGIVLVADGTVQLVGTSGGDFILGGRRVETGMADGSVYDFRMEGGQFLIAPASGARYRHGLQIYGFVHSSFAAISVSGEFGAGEAERAAIAIDRSWVNRFTAMAAACPGTPNAGGRSVAIRCGPDNVNANMFAGCRIRGIGGQPGAAGSIGMVLTGTANRVANCDISAVSTGIELVAARGCTLSDNYHESVRRPIAAETGNSSGCIITGGYFEIGEGAVALSLGSSQATTVVGGYFRGSGRGGTFIDRGKACYGLTVLEPMLTGIETVYRGRDAGAAGAGAAATRVSAAGIVFPDRPAISDHPRTLDDYQEGRFAPQGNGIVFAESSASFTKIGDTVQLRFRLNFPVTTSGAEATLLALPFSAMDGEGAGVLLGDQRNPDGNVAAIRGDRMVIIDPKTGRVRTNKEISGQFYSGVAIYRAVA